MKKLWVNFFRKIYQLNTFLYKKNLFTFIILHFHLKIYIISSNFILIMFKNIYLIFKEII